MTAVGMSLGWIPHLFSLEIRKTLSYRVDFWVNFAGSVAVELIIAFFLWRAVFDVRGAQQLGGYSFHSMLLYYLLIALSRKAVIAGEHGFIAAEIYDGSLNRYLVYPVSFSIYKYVAWMASAAMGLLQLGLSLALFLGFFGAPVDHPLTLPGLLMGISALWSASTIYFLLTMTFDMVAFWAENVWSLQVMLRFISNLLGGGLIPLSLFPLWAQSGLPFLPFPYLISFPIRCLMGEVGIHEWLIGMGASLGWMLVFGAVMAWVWRRGTLQYSGVGI